MVKNHKILHKMSTALSQKFIKGTYRDLCHLNHFNMKFHWHKWFFHSFLSFLSYLISKVSVYSSKSTLKSPKTRLTIYCENGVYEMSIAISRKLFGVSEQYSCQWINMFEIIKTYKQICRTRINFRHIAVDMSYIPFL